MTDFVTCETLAEIDAYSRLAAGQYELAYTDISHLPKDEWTPVLELNLIDAPGQGLFPDAEKAFSAEQALDKIQDARRSHLLKDVLGLSLARVGIVQPQLPGDLFARVNELHGQDGIVLIPDSNSLYNGSLHWLLQVLRDTTVWILPFVVSLTQIQERDARLKELVRKGPDQKGLQALRLRATINSSLGLLQRHRSKYQVLELDPSLLRYLKLAPSDGEGNVLEDRLLIEGVHAILRATRTRATQVVVTSDVLLARVLEAEGITHLFLPPPQLPTGQFSSLRFDALARRFAGAPLRVLMWDLAHTLSSIRITSEQGEGFKLSAYWPGKTPEDWRVERLMFEPVASGDQEHSPELQAEPTGTVKAEPEPTSKPRVRKPSERLKTPPPSNAAAKHAGSESSDAFLPRASLTQVLKIGGAVRVIKQGDLASIVGAVADDDRPTPEIARRALQILSRIGAVLHEGREYLATSVLDEIDEALGVGELDRIHAIFLRFPPYSLIARTLAEQQRVARDSVEALLRTVASGPINTDAASRLPRFHTLLGQAWSDGTEYRDGASRPPLEIVEQAFRLSFGDTQRDGFAKVEDLVPDLCRKLSMSPWALHRYLGRLLDQGGLAEFTFQPAAGKRPLVRDKVLSGSLLDPREFPVPLDRIIVGGRPIFTIGRRAA